MQKIVCRQQLLPILPQLQPEREGCVRGYGQRIHPSKPPWKPGSLTVTGSGQVGIVLPGGTGGGGPPGKDIRRNRVPAGGKKRDNLGIKMMTRTDCNTVRDWVRNRDMNGRTEGGDRAHRQPSNRVRQDLEGHWTHWEKVHGDRMLAGSKVALRIAY